MAKAIWNGEVIAESKKTREIEGNRYFPPAAVKKKFLKKSEKHYVCPWKGTANYYNVVVDDKVNWDGAWYYPNPTNDARSIKNYIAFWHGVEIQE
jgi:uncharacterized protein (DUF427 family)